MKFKQLAPKVRREAAVKLVGDEYHIGSQTPAAWRVNPKNRKTSPARMYLRLLCSCRSQSGFVTVCAPPPIEPEPGRVIDGEPRNTLTSSIATRQAPMMSQTRPMVVSIAGRLAVMIERPNLIWTTKQDRHIRSQASRLVVEMAANLLQYGPSGHVPFFIPV